MKIPCGILGASGYTGAELLRLLSAHPKIEPTVLTADSLAGESVGSVYPHLTRYRDRKYTRQQESEAELKHCELVFCALPHGEAMAILPKLTNRVIVDLGGDFRLKDHSQYEKWYGLKHAAPNELSRWVYGLPELFREEIRGATRIANPGCYATAAILSSAPLLRSGLVKGALSLIGVSGTSGAGRQPKSNLHFSHVFEDLRAYKVAEHQHTPEIESALSRFSKVPVGVTFVPNIAPMSRGIQMTVVAQAASGVSEAKLMEAFNSQYSGSEFVRVSEDLPGTKDVRASNFVVISPRFDNRTGQIVVSSVLDNLVKGAAGQAIQNANIALGFEESLGLGAPGVYP